MCAERCRVEFRVSEHYTSYSPSSYDERKIYERMLRIEAGFCRMNLSNDVSRFSIRRETRHSSRGARCGRAIPRRAGRSIAIQRSSDFASGVAVRVS